MTDNKLPAHDPIRRIASDIATDAVPVGISGEPDFVAWSAVVDDLRDDIDRQVRAAAEA